MNRQCLGCPDAQKCVGGGGTHERSGGNGGHCDLLSASPLSLLILVLTDDGCGFFLLAVLKADVCLLKWPDLHQCCCDSLFSLFSVCYMVGLGAGEWLGTL